MLDLILKLFLTILEAPGGGGRSLQEPMLTPSGLDFGASGSWFSRPRSLHRHPGRKHVRRQAPG